MGHTLSEEFSAVCGKNTSEFAKTDTIQEKMRILKQEGHLYSLDSLEIKYGKFVQHT